MGSLAEQYQPAAVEKTARAVWSARGFPRSDGVIGRSNSPLVHQFEGSYSGTESPTAIALRAIVADVDARYLALAGRRALGTLRRVPDLTADPVAALLRSLSVWTGGSSGQPYESGERRAGIEAILGRMAGRGLVVTRDASLRICSSCGAPRSPERIVYQQEEGDTSLVRFPVIDGGRTIQALAWVDAPWRLLGATALLLHPELPYVVARYRRKGVDELILTSRPSLARLADWLADAEIEVLEETPGARWNGHPYEYPLRAEFPMGSELVPPGGTLQAVPEVGDSGTGIVPLVPGHGGTDAQLADRLGVTGWPLVTPHGRLGTTLVHKYAGLDLPTASDFVLRDLGEAGALFARLRVRRGVPHCDVCGTPLVWAPGRAWCLEPSRLPADRLETYRRLLPNDPPIAHIEIAAWPVSDSITGTHGPDSATLLECPQCERLAPPGAELTCECGSARRAVTRRLLPAIQGILGAWARFDPFPPGDSVWIYLNERRRAPALAHQLAVLSAVPGTPADVGLTVVPGLPEADLPGLVAVLGSDAVRAGLVRGILRGRAGPMLPDRCRQEARRLEQYWYLARSVLEQIDPAGLTSSSAPIAGYVSELEPEDRAILSRWERVRVGALADYDAQLPERAFRRLVRFLANDLPQYRALVRPRLRASSNAPTRRSALRTLQHLLRATALLLGPVIPHTAELVYGAATPGGTSLFEASLDPLDANLLDDERGKGWERWRSVLESLDRFRSQYGIPADHPLPSMVVVLSTDEAAQGFRSDRPTLERLGNVSRLEAFGPSSPWTGRRRDLEPILTEIQKLYPHEGTQIAHLLRHMPARKRPEPGSTEELSVVIQGVPRKVTASMVTYVERIPERVIPVPWGRGEMYVEMPASRPLPAHLPPPLSTDAFGLVRRAERALRQRDVTPGARTPPLVIATLDPLAAELRGIAVPLAAYLGVEEVRVVDDYHAFPSRESEQGRTRTGVRWWIHLPGIAPRTRPEKHRVALPYRSRVRPPRPSATTVETELDYASPEWIAREEQIRSLMQELDGVLGAPLLGFSKVAGAWDAGLQSRSAFETVDFDTLAALPGFGWTVAGALVERLGRVPPPRPPRVYSVAAPGPASDVPREEGAGPPSYLEPHSIPAAPPAMTATRASSPVRPTPPRGTVSPTSRGPTSGEPKSPPTSRLYPEPPREFVPQPVPPVEPLTPPASPVVPPLEVERAPEDVGTSPDEPSQPAPDPAPDAPPDPTEVPALAVGSPAGLSPELPPASDETDSGMVTLIPEVETASPAAPMPLPEIDLAPFGAERVADDAPTAFRPETTEVPGSSPTTIPPEEASLPGTEDRAFEPATVEVAPPPLAVEADNEAVQDSVRPPAPDPGVVPAARPEPSPDQLPPDRSEGMISEGAPDPAIPVDPAESVELVPPEEPLPELEATPPPGSTTTPSSEGFPPDEVESRNSPTSDPPRDVPGIVPPLETAVPADTEPVEPGGTSEETDLPPSGPESSGGDLPAPAAGMEAETAGPPGAESAPPPAAFAPPPASPAPPPAPAVALGGIRVIVSPSYLPALQEFLDTTSAGHRGVAVVRESPERLRTHVGSRPVEVYWLTNLGRGLTLKPSDLPAYCAFLEKAVQQDRVTAFFLEGIEYLARLHGMDRIIESLANFHALAIEHEALVWVCVHPGLLAPQDLDRLVSAFR